jgi:hypothetical protein
LQDGHPRTLNGFEASVTIWLWKMNLIV